MKKLIITGSFLLLALVLLLPAASAGEAALTNADVTKMTKAGLDKDLILGKVKQAENVDFKLDTDDLIALSEAGVHKDVVAAMLGRSSKAKAPAPKAASGGGGYGDPVVNLVTVDGSIELIGIEGTHEQFAAPFVGLRHFLEFDDEEAETRITDREPILELFLDKNPRRSWWIVRLDPDDDDATRGLDLQSAGAWGGAHSYEADEDSVISSELVEAQPGVWHFKPKKSLKPGEYGLYTEKDGIVYDFGVDKK